MTIQRVKTSLWVFDIGFRRMNAELAPGWMPQMLVFCLLFLAMIAAFEGGLPEKWPFAAIAAIDLLATQRFVRASIRRLRRLGFVSATRARWWIEVAALTWTWCMSCGVFGITHASPAVALPARQEAILAFARNCMLCLFGIFLGCASAGYLLGLAQRKRIRGRSAELVSWFFWMFVGVATAVVLVPQVPVLTTWVAPMLAVISAVVLAAAGFLALNQRIGQPSGGDGNSPPRFARGRVN